MLEHGELVQRIGEAALLGGALGWEREQEAHSAGLRTYLITTLTAATFMIVSSQFVFFQGYEPGDGLRVDGSRIASGVVMGIGFLAGGAILRHGPGARGLTTAAGLWMATAVGMAAGAGMFWFAAAVTALGVVVLSLLHKLERIVGRLRCRVSVEFAGATLPQIEEPLRRDGMRIEVLERDEGAVPERVVLSLVLRRRDGIERVTALLRAVPGVGRVMVEVS